MIISIYAVHTIGSMVYFMTHGKNMQKPWNDTRFINHSPSEKNKHLLVGCGEEFLILNMFQFMDL